MTVSPATRRIPFIQTMDLVGVALVILLVIVIFTPVTRTMLLNSASDYPTHIGVTDQLLETGTITRPQFLFHVNTAVVYQILAGFDWMRVRFAALAVVLLYRVVFAASIYALLRSALGTLIRPPTVALLVFTTLALMMITPITFLTWGQQRLHFGYEPINVYHNPTIELLRVFSLAIFLLAYRTLPRPSSANHAGIWLALAVLIVLATLAKPNYTLIVLPLFGLVGLYRAYQRQPFDWYAFVIGLVLPAAVVLAWQLNFHSSELGRGIAIAPFAIHRPNVIETPISMLFALMVYGLYFETARKDYLLNLSWLSFFISLGFAYTFVEVGQEFSRNFTQGGRLTLSFVFIFSVRLLLLYYRERALGWRQALRDRRLIVVIVIFALHLICGFYWYGIHLLREDFQRWWR